MNTRLEELLESYNNVQIEETKIKTQKDELKLQILEEMAKENTTKYLTEDNISATIAKKETFKYVDELSMINYLQENGYSQFVELKIKTTDMNKELKKSTQLSEALTPYVTKSVVESLSVKKN